MHPMASKFPINPRETFWKSVDIADLKSSVYDGCHATAKTTWPKSSQTSIVYNVNSMLQPTQMLDTVGLGPDVSKLCVEGFDFHKQLHLHGWLLQEFAKELLIIKCRNDEIRHSRKAIVFFALTLNRNRGFFPFPYRCFARWRSNIQT